MIFGNRVWHRIGALRCRVSANRTSPNVLSGTVAKGAKQLVLWTLVVTASFLFAVKASAANGATSHAIAATTASLLLSDQGQWAKRAVWDSVAAENQRRPIRLVGHKGGGRGLGNRGGRRDSQVKSRNGRSGMRTLGRQKKFGKRSGRTRDAKRTRKTGTNWSSGQRKTKVKRSHSHRRIKNDAAATRNAKKKRTIRAKSNISSKQKARRKASTVRKATTRNVQRPKAISNQATRKKGNTRAARSPSGKAVEAARKIVATPKPKPAPSNRRKPAQTGAARAADSVGVEIMQGSRPITRARAGDEAPAENAGSENGDASASPRQPAARAQEPRISGNGSDRRNNAGTSRQAAPSTIVRAKADHKLPDDFRTPDAMRKLIAASNSSARRNNSDPATTAATAIRLTGELAQLGLSDETVRAAVGTYLDNPTDEGEEDAKLAGTAAAFDIPLEAARRVQVRDNATLTARQLLEFIATTQRVGDIEVLTDMKTEGYWARVAEVGIDQAIKDAIVRGQGLPPAAAANQMTAVELLDVMTQAQITGRVSALGTKEFWQAQDKRPTVDRGAAGSGAASTGDSTGGGAAPAVGGTVITDQPVRTKPTDSATGGGAAGAADSATGSGAANAGATGTAQTGKGAYAGAADDAARGRGTVTGTIGNAGSSSGNAGASSGNAGSAAQRSEENRRQNSEPVVGAGAPGSGQSGVGSSGEGTGFGAGKPDAHDGKADPQTGSYVVVTHNEDGSVTVSHHQITDGDGDGTVTAGDSHQFDTEVYTQNEEGTWVNQRGDEYRALDGSDSPPPEGIYATEFGDDGSYMVVDNDGGEESDGASSASSGDSGSSNSTSSDESSDTSSDSDGDGCSESGDCDGEEQDTAADDSAQEESDDAGASSDSTPTPDGRDRFGPRMTIEQLIAALKNPATRAQAQRTLDQIMLNAPGGTLGAPMRGPRRGLFLPPVMQSEADQETERAIGSNSGGGSVDAPERARSSGMLDARTTKELLARRGGGYTDPPDDAPGAAPSTNGGTPPKGGTVPVPSGPNPSSGASNARLPGSTQDSGDDDDPDAPLGPEGAGQWQTRSAAQAASSRAAASERIRAVSRMLLRFEQR